MLRPGEGDIELAEEVKLPDAGDRLELRSPVATAELLVDGGFGPVCPSPI
jgi:hypothetical protein